MPTPTYTPLANITLGSSAASVTFSSISQAYRDLIIIADIIGNSTTNNGYTGFRFNSDTGSNYSRVYMVGNGSSTASGSDTSAYLYGFGYPGSTSGSRANGILQIMDYSATDKHKTALQRENNNPTNTAAGAGRWASTSAITTITLSAILNDYGTGSTFALFGVAA